MDLNGFVDLHIHSNFSDGSCTPRQLVEMAKELGLDYIALTDHETISGVDEGYAAAKRMNVNFLPGVELNGVADDLPIEMGRGTPVHVLGYFNIDTIHNLDSIFYDLLAARRKRNQGIVELANRHGIDMSYDDILELADGNIITRGHFAQYMMNTGKGVNHSLRDTIDAYFAEGKPLYVAREEAGTSACIKKIKEAGGICVIAHPGLLKIDAEKMDQMFKYVKYLGADGVEAIYVENTPEQTDMLIDLARENDLNITGGSDFHGKLKPHIKMGTGLGNLRVPLKCAEWIIERIN